MDKVSCEEVWDWDFKTLLRHAEAGNAAAQHRLGGLYDLEPDGAELAVYWWRKAAEQGCAPAMNDLGANYQNGSGVEKNSAAALEWYRRAAELGNSMAMANLGRVYELGEGVPADERLMVHWYRKGAELNSSDAQLALGHCYETGHGVVQNHALAAYWYSRAAALGEPVAWLRLGCLYDSGMGVPHDVSLAVRFYRRAAEQGCRRRSIIWPVAANWVRGCRQIQLRRCIGIPWRLTAGIPMLSGACPWRTGMGISD